MQSPTRDIFIEIGSYLLLHSVQIKTGTKLKLHQFQRLWNRGEYLWVVGILKLMIEKRGIYI